MANQLASHLKLGAAYIRYSSNMQDDNFSLDAQLRQIKARAAADGVTIVKVYSDPATSAYTKKFRPGIVEMLKVRKEESLNFSMYIKWID